MSNTEPKIFNEQGFLTKDGSSFVNDGFIKELKRVVNTAKCSSDVDIINGLLKSITDDHCSKIKIEFGKNVPNPIFKVIQGGKIT